MCSQNHGKKVLARITYHPNPPGCKACEIDHITPLSKGRRDDPSNTQGLATGAAPKEDEARSAGAIAEGRSG